MKISQTNYNYRQEICVLLHGIGQSCNSYLEIEACETNITNGI